MQDVESKPEVMDTDAGGDTAASDKPTNGDTDLKPDAGGDADADMKSEEEEEEEEESKPATPKKSTPKKAPAKKKEVEDEEEDDDEEEEDDEEGTPKSKSWKRTEYKPLTDVIFCILFSYKLPICTQLTVLLI